MAEFLFHLEKQQKNFNNNNNNEKKKENTKDNKNILIESIETLEKHIIQLIKKRNYHIFGKILFILFILFIYFYTLWKFFFIFLGFTIFFLNCISNLLLFYK